MIADTAFVTPMGWIIFNALVLFLLALDIGVFNKKAHVVKVKEALLWSAFWIGLALLFNVWIDYYLGRQAAFDFLTGYLLEKSLSVDNLFIFALVFKYFHIPAQNQHRLLFFGIIGALVMRAIFIFAGISLIQKFSWTIYLFGAFLIFTGFKMAFKHDEESLHPDELWIVRLARKYLPIHPVTHYEQFFVKDQGKWWATSLFIVLLVIETTDLIFAVDSIPAILAITQNAFIVYTSNVFAILGLRSLYFALSGIMAMFHHLHYALAGILAFIGCKMALHSWIKIPTLFSLSLILVAILISIFTSYLFPEKK